MLPRYPGWFSATFWGTTFFSVGPPPVGNGDLVVCWPVLGLGHVEKLRARAENIKTQFPGARAPETEKENLPRDPRWLSATFFHFPFWPTGPAGVGNFGTQRNPGRGLKTEKKRNFSVLVVPKGGGGEFPRNPDGGLPIF